MLLAVDIGNSRTKFGVFDGESLGYLLTLPRFETLLFWLPVMQLLTSRAAPMDHPA